MQLSPNKYAAQLSRLLEAADSSSEQQKHKQDSETKVHIAGAGGTLTAAYEQLRNAAEYAEEHLLLQRAIRRFYRRLFLLKDLKQIKDSGEELAIELTLAGYIENDTIPTSVVKQISRLAKQYYEAHEMLLRRGKIGHHAAEDWTLDVLAVRVEWLLNDPAVTTAYVQFVHGYFLSQTDLDKLLGGHTTDLEASLFIAIHRALLKSDPALARTSLLDAYKKTPSDLDEYILVNTQIDQVFKSPATEKLFRYVDRRGAPLRVLRQMIDHDEQLAEKLTKPQEFLNAFEVQVTNDYESINRRINRGIIKSVIFLIITKVIVGIAIEVPYDYFIIGAIVWLPLIINLLFPPLYMVLLRMTLMLPGPANTRRLSQQMERILFHPPSKELERVSAPSFGFGYNLAYALVFIIVFGGIGTWLWYSFDFELLHLFIFFLFLSGASFLGFRLSRMIREIEAVDSDQNAVTTVRDFLYMPFVVVGRYMSEKYARVNVIAITLDMLIELPLKTILRLIRQWGAFISAKQDQL